MLFKIGESYIKDKNLMENFSLCASNILQILYHTELPDYPTFSSMFFHFTIFAVGSFFNCNNGHFITVGHIIKHEKENENKKFLEAPIYHVTALRAMFKSLKHLC